MHCRQWGFSLRYAAVSPEPGPSVPPRGRRLSVFAFPLALLALGAVAILALRMPAVIVTGLPAEPGIEDVVASVHGRLGVESGELRLHSTLLGDGGSPDVALAVRTAQRLRDGDETWAGDPRRWVAIAALELAANRPSEAERFYRRAADAASGYGEARQGLGVALALRAATEGGAARARGLRLRAISQLAAVNEADPAYDAALYDRALLLARVGRSEEAQRWAAAYLARDPESHWAVAMRGVLDAAQP